MMNRFRTIVCVLIGCGLVALSGCERLRKQSMRNNAELPASSIDPVAGDPSFQRPSELDGFFKGGRAGTFSSEARDIEKSLGVGR